MTERPKPYIGISGVVSPEQQHQLVEQFTNLNLGNERRLALGVKAVHKTQFMDIENKYGREWYPVGEKAFASALEPSADYLGVAQVCFDASFVHDAKYRDELVARIQRRGAGWLDAIQFDMLPWHDEPMMLEWVERVKSETGMQILLQAHGETMKMLGPDRTARMLGHHAHAVDYVLFDASHGKGVELSTTSLLPFLDAAYSSEALTGVGVSIAGGLNANVVRRHLPETLDRYPDVSWDAEGQLHPIDERGKRPIDMNAAEQYLAASQEVLQASV